MLAGMRGIGRCSGRGKTCRSAWTGSSNRRCAQDGVRHGWIEFLGRHVEGLRRASVLLLQPPQTLTRRSFILQAAASNAACFFCKPAPRGELVVHRQFLGAAIGHACILPSK